MTDAELQQHQGEIVRLQTEIDALSVVERDCIEKAREFNDARRAATNKRTGLMHRADQLRTAMAQELMRRDVEVKRLAREKSEQERLVKERAEADKPPAE